MRKRRILWGILLAVLFVNMVLSESAAGIYLLLGTLFIPLGTILLTEITVKSVDADVILPKTCGKRQLIQGCLHLSAKGLLPVFRGEIDVEIKNLLTGEVRMERIVTSFSKERETISFSMIHTYCGVVQVSVAKVTVFDPFCLWRKTIYPETKTTVTVLPDTFDLHLELVHGAMFNCESIEYAQERTGNDVSEIFGIREYQEGDNIRNIHWKLSSKCDDLLVKLPSLPLENSLLLLLETALKDEDEMQPAAFDALAEIYMTISQTLIDNEIAHKVGWYDQKTDNMFIFEISDEDDLHGIMGKTLAAERAVNPKHAVSQYLDEVGHFEQAHIVYVTHRDEGYLEQTPDEIIKTTVVCSQKGVKAVGVYDYTCTPADYPIQLRSMTI